MNSSRYKLDIGSGHIGCYRQPGEDPTNHRYRNVILTNALDGLFFLTFQSNHLNVLPHSGISKSLKNGPPLFQNLFLPESLSIQCGEESGISASTITKELQNIQ